jgi:hypothetical protein
VIFLFGVFYLVGLYKQNTNLEYHRPEFESYMDLADDDQMDMTDEELLEWAESNLNL